MLCGSLRLTTDYGRLGILAAAALTVGLIADASGRPGRTVGALTAAWSRWRPSRRWQYRPPRLLAHRFTAWDVFPGYELPQPPNALRLLTLWRFDPLIGTRSIGARRAATWQVLFGSDGEGDRWPPDDRRPGWPDASALLFVSSSGVKGVRLGDVRRGMSEHMTLNMFIGVPWFWAHRRRLRRPCDPRRPGSPPGPREWLLWLVHSPVTRFILAPGDGVRLVRPDPSTPSTSHRS